MVSFSAAAEALYLSQSALSQQIRTLEGQLQFELFQHVPRRVVLTPAGQDFYPKAKQLVALYQQAVRHARAVQQQENPPERHLIIAGCHEAMRIPCDVFPDKRALWRLVHAYSGDSAPTRRDLAKPGGRLDASSWKCRISTRRGLPLCRCSICQNFASPSTRPLICRWAD